MPATRWSRPSNAGPAGNGAARGRAPPRTTSTSPPTVAERMRFELDDDLVLRSLRAEDARELYAVIEAHREHLSQWMPWAAGQTLAGTEIFIRSAIRQERDRDGFQ